MKKPAYDIEQRIFALNWFSNMASNKFGTAAVLQENLRITLENLFKDSDMIDLIGNWTLEWGPVVVEEGKDDTNKVHVSTNAMFVAKQTKYDGKNDHYVIAIAGTNAISRYGWFVEDFYTEKMVLWKDAGKNNCQDSTNLQPDAPRVSMGTCIGLKVLMDMAWQPTHEVRKFLFKKTTPNGDAQTLLHFLQEKFGGPDAPADLVTVTGHSLGGALSSSLALRLAELQWNKVTDSAEESYWNPSHTVTLTAMPTAGASPGNKAFSEYYGNIMGTKTIRVWNSIDPVPHGHQPSMVQFIPHLYYPYIVPDAALYAFAGAILVNSYRGTEPTFIKGGYYTQLMPRVAPMAGQYNALFSPVSNGVILTFCAENVLPKVLEFLKIPKSIIEKVMLIVNDIVKIDNWLGAPGALFEKLAQLIMKIPAVEGLVQKIMAAIKWALSFFTSFFAYIQQLGYQHVWAYPDLLKMTGFKNATVKHMKAKPEEDLDDLMKAGFGKIGKTWQTILTDDFLQKNIQLEM